MATEIVHNCTGIVRWFSRLKGYGFITPTIGGQEVFVHYSAIEGVGYRNLHEGDPVQYELSDRGRGPIAVSVRVYRGRPWPATASQEE